jgi:hypothetical protein
MILRYYKLQINLELVDVGEMPEPTEQAPEAKRQHPMLRDPLDRQEELADKALRLISAGAAALGPPMPQRPQAVIQLAETYDVPSENFAEALNVLRQFHELASRLGMPAASMPDQSPRGFVTPYR